MSYKRSVNVDKQQTEGESSIPEAILVKNGRYRHKSGVLPERLSGAIPNLVTIIMAHRDSLKTSGYSRCRLVKSYFPQRDQIIQTEICKKKH